jgi:hypothetical protein
MKRTFSLVLKTLVSKNFFALILFVFITLRTAHAQPYRMQPPQSQPSSSTSAQTTVQQPDSATIAEARFYALQAVEESNKKNHRKAEELFTKAVGFVADGNLYIRRAIERYYLSNEIAMLEDISTAVSVCPPCAGETVKAGEALEMKELLTSITHGMIYFTAGYFPKAATLLEQAQKLGSNSSTVEFLLGMARIISGSNVRAGCANCERAASVGNPLAYGMRFASDTLAKYCGVIIPRDANFQRRYDEMDSITFATNKLDLKQGFPRPRQLYPRSDNDSATIEIAGSLRLLGYDSALVQVFKNNILVQHTSQPLQYFMAIGVKDTVTFTDFALKASIHAELSEYKIRFAVKSLARREDRTLAMSDSVVCGDVFAVCGQSNSILGRVPPSEHREFMRTYVGGLSGSGWTMTDVTNNRYGFPSPSGNIHNRVGGIGSAMQRFLVEQTKIPVCVMQLSAQDVALVADYLPAGQSVGGMSLINAYEQLVLRLQEAKIKDAVKGIVWYQGESDSSNSYGNKLKTLWDSWQADLPALRRMYVVQPRPSNCGNAVNATQAGVREAQRLFARAAPNVTLLAASSNIGGHDGCHFEDSAYIPLGEQLARLVAKDFYATSAFNFSDTIDIASPMVERATLNAARTELTIEFSPATTTLVATNDTLVAGKIRRLADAFSLAVKEGKKEREKTDMVKSVAVSGNRVTLSFKQPLKTVSTVQGVSYLPAQFYPDGKPSAVYEGPWLVTKRGVGTASFQRFPVTLETSAANSSK